MQIKSKIFFILVYRGRCAIGRMGLNIGYIPVTYHRESRTYRALIAHLSRTNHALIFRVNFIQLILYIYVVYIHNLKGIFGKKERILCKNTLF